MPHEITSNKELIIRGDDVFSRESFETPLGGIEELLQEHLQNGLVSYINLKFPPVLSKWTTGTYFGQHKNHLLAYFEVSYFPLTGSCLQKTGDYVNTYIFATKTLQQMEELGYDRLNIREQEGHPKWTFPEALTAYIMIPFELETNAVSEPYFFTLNENFEPMMPKFPNIFDTGRICTGESFGNRNDADVRRTDKVPLLHLKYALNAIHEAPINNDLRQADSEFAQWDLDGKQKDLPLNSHHYHQITDDRIVQFAKWRKENA